MDRSSTHHKVQLYQYRLRRLCIDSTQLYINTNQNTGNAVSAFFTRNKRDWMIRHPVACVFGGRGKRCPVLAISQTPHAVVIRRRRVTPLFVARRSKCAGRPALGVSAFLPASSSRIDKRESDLNTRKLYLKNFYYAVGAPFNLCKPRVAICCFVSPQKIIRIVCIELKYPKIILLNDFVWKQNYW